MTGIDDDIATVRAVHDDPVSFDTLRWKALRLADELVPLRAEVDSLRLALGVHTRTVTDLRAELTAAELLIDGLRENVDLAEHDRSEAEAELAAARVEVEDARHDYRAANDAGQACYARMVWLEAKLAAQEPLVAAALAYRDEWYATGVCQTVRAKLFRAVDAYRVLQAQGETGACCIEGFQDDCCAGIWCHVSICEHPEHPERAGVQGEPETAAVSVHCNGCGTSHHPNIVGVACRADSVPTETPPSHAFKASGYLDICEARDDRPPKSWGCCLPASHPVHEGEATDV